jgi:hypothetical protein
MRPIIEQMSEADNESFRTLAYTIGGMMVWPATQVNRQWTINGARGCTKSIDDRFDLTVECVRRFYLSVASPLEPTFTRYRDFFDLFVDFRGFIEFFLLQDIVSENCSSVSFFVPFGEFETRGVPRDLETYVSYSCRAMEFVHARNDRISRLHPVQAADNRANAPDLQLRE